MATRNFTDSEEIEIAKLYTVGKFGVKQIKRAYGFKHHISFSAALKRHGIKIRSNHEANRIYKVNPHVFDVIDNEQAAYWLGFIYADGCVHNRSLSIAIKRKDIEIIQGLKLFLESEHPINLTMCGASNTNKRYKQAQFFVTHQHLAKRLHQLGIVAGRGQSNKTVSQIPNSLIHHWIRGLMDGDGSWHERPGISLCGEKSLLEHVRRTLSENVDTNQNMKIHKHKTAKIHQLRYGGRLQCLRIADWLYKDATIWLERKREVWENWPKPQVQIKKAISKDDL